MKALLELSTELISLTKRNNIDEVFDKIDKLYHNRKDNTIEDIVALVDDLAEFKSVTGRLLSYTIYLVTMLLLSCALKVPLVQ
jgi:hypothetical protein